MNTTKHLGPTAEPRTSGPLRICLVSAAYYPYPSGVSEHVHHLALSLAERGHHIHLLTTNYSLPDPRAAAHESCPDAGRFAVTRLGRAVLVPMNRSYATLPVGIGLAGQVRRFFKERSFDIVHCHGMFWPEISYWALRYSNAVRLVTFLTAGFKTGSFGSGLFRAMFGGLLGRIHGLVPISNRAWEAFRAYVPGTPRTIPCGIDLNRFCPGPTTPPDPERPTILFLGRLDRRKGLLVLLDAMPRILSAVPDARLLVVGRGPEETAARRRCDTLRISGAVEFVGTASREELPRYYSSSSVYCSPALGGETLGIVLLEAMASGTPVVASDIPGYDETVENGRSGLLVPPRDSDALAETLTRVLQDRELRRGLAITGLARARLYAWPIIARRTEDYYRDLIAGGSAAGSRAFGAE